jgi:hypothetical protein
VVAPDRRSRIPNLGLRGPLIPVCLAWGVLLVTGVVLALTGQIDLTLFGHPIAGERFPFAGGLAVSGFAIWHLGNRTERERAACWFTLAAAGMAFIAAPIDYTQFSAGWLAYQTPTWLAHVGLCAQLLAWSVVARKPQQLGLYIMAFGIGIEAFCLFPLEILATRPADCTAGMMLTCLTGSATAAMALPAAVTIALIVLWLNPIEAALRKR